MSVTYYNRFKRDLLKGDIDLDSADIRAIPIMDPAQSGNDPQAAGEEDRATLSAMFGTGLTGAELDDTGYSRPGAMTGKTVTQDDANDRAYFTANDVTISSLNEDGSYPIAGILYYVHVTDDTDSVPAVYAPYSALQTPGASFTIEHNSSGIIGVT